MLTSFCLLLPQMNSSNGRVEASVFPCFILCTALIKPSYLALCNNIQLEYTLCIAFVSVQRQTLLSAGLFAMNIRPQVSWPI